MHAWAPRLYSTQILISAPMGKCNDKGMLGKMKCSFGGLDKNTLSEILALSPVSVTKLTM